MTNHEPENDHQTTVIAYLDKDLRDLKWRLIGAVILGLAIGLGGSILKFFP